MYSSFRNYLVTFLISIVIFGLIAYFAVTFALEPLVTDSNAPGETVQPGDIIQAVTEASDSVSGTDFSYIDSDSFTMLLIGTDYRPAVMTDYNVSTTTDGLPDPKRTIQADLIIIARVDKERGEIMLSAVPSNMELTVSGVKYQLRDLYSEKGLNFLIDKVTAVTGLKFDYYACIHIQDFIDLVDKLGGFNFDVPGDMNYEDHKEGLSIHISKGYQWLSGQNVAKMLRYRGYSDGNISRMSNAINFLKKAVIDYLTEPQFKSRALELYSQVIDYTKTNLWMENMAAELDLIYAIPNFKYVALVYPGTTVGSGDDEYFDPQISDAIEMYFNYRTQY